MKIIYFSDNYAYDVMGTKRSIAEEVSKRGYNVLVIDKKQINKILDIIKLHNPDQVWLVHSWLSIPKNLRKRVKIPVIGFGFSDPYDFNLDRLKDLNMYITNNYDCYLNCKNSLPTHYNPTACDLSFHKNLNLKKDIDISLIGVAHHKRFKNPNERIDIINKLKKDFPNYKIECYGNGWSNPSISGQKFLEVINRSKIGLDIQDIFSPLAHRMFEYIACGTPIITRNRPEIFKIFNDHEILTYNNYEHLKYQLHYYLNNLELLNIITKNGYIKCREQNDITNRVDKILEFINQNI